MNKPAIEGIGLALGIKRLATAALAFSWLVTGAVSPAWAQMNVVVIMTDDQRFDTLPMMPAVSDLASQGVRFTNAYMSTPLCGPARASMFSGGYLAQNTGVLTHAAPNGGAKQFNDADNLGAELQAAGYQTLFVGKWVNGYEGMGKYVPPGWSRFVGRHSYATSTSWSSFQYTVGSSTQNASTGTYATASQYTTYYERDQVLDFLNDTPGDQPFFVFWNPSAPHEPATPAPGDGSLFADYLYRDRGYGESDLSDKPRWVRTNTVTDTDEFVRDQLRTLQGIDRSVEDLVDRLKALGHFDNTLIVYTSDNGYLWGEHGLWAKNKAYEESVRVPLVVVMPGVAPRTDASLIAVNLDVGPTIFELAGIARQTDGMSLVPLLGNPALPLRSELFFEASAENAGGNAIWAAVRDEQWKYVRYWTGEEELYDLNADPYELNSRHNDPAVSTIKAGLSTRTTQLLGLAIVPVSTFPAGKVNKAYSYQMKTWGGVSPFTWTVNSGQLPPGLQLNETTGRITGVPSSQGSYQFAVRVTDSSLATQAGNPKTFVTKSTNLKINP